MEDGARGDHKLAAVEVEVGEDGVRNGVSRKVEGECGDVIENGDVGCEVEDGLDATVDVGKGDYDL